jgi:2-dehydro-3-deoxyphosphogluconate aldolase/(4S)-4-hydroxy-2-oxoglutarate aldolase
MQQRITSFIETHPPILPIITVELLDNLLPLVDALAQGGIHAIEITLRNPLGMQSLAYLRKHRPELFLCAGSITSTEELRQAAALNVDLLITPGISTHILEAAEKCEATLLPGISTASDILLAIEYGYHYLKFFPAEALGGISYLHALSAPFPDVKFCPTGGINDKNVNQYLRLNHVAFVGGSWLLPQSLLLENSWKEIENNARSLLQSIQPK